MRSTGSEIRRESPTNEGSHEKRASGAVPPALADELALQLPAWASMLYPVVGTPPLKSSEKKVCELTVKEEVAINSKRMYSVFIVLYCFDN